MTRLESRSETPAHRPRSVSEKTLRLPACVRSHGSNVAISALLVLLMASPDTLHAAEPDLPELSDDAALLFGRVDRAMRDLNGFLRAIDFERPAVVGLNYFSVSCGGVDAIRDLEEGRGVDPETLAGLQAGFALPEVARHLNVTKIPSATGGFTVKIDAADRRLRYKGTVVRLYSPTRLRTLFERREIFRIDHERRRKEAINEFVGIRRRELGVLENSTAAAQVEANELADRYLQIQPLIADLEAALQSEVGANSIMQGTIQHFFGLSVGGINVTGDLDQRGVVDPETLAAIYADRISADFVDSISVQDGRVQYNGDEIRMYSVKELQTHFANREKLVLQSVE